MIKSYLDLKENTLYRDNKTGLATNGMAWLEIFQEDCISREVLPSQFYWEEFNYNTSLSVYKR